MWHRTPPFDGVSATKYALSFELGDTGMFNKIAIVVVAAVLVTGLPFFLAPLIPNAEARMPQVSANLSTKGDRLPALVQGSTCSVPVWPNYDTRCLFDLRRPLGEVRPVRVIDLTRRDR
jgi:hypothetical protein